MAEGALRGWDLWNARWREPLYHPDGFLLLSPEVLQRGGFEYESLALLEQRVKRLALEVMEARERSTAGPSRPSLFVSRARCGNQGSGPRAEGTRRSPS